SAAAEAAGFSGVMAADHFQPWVPQQGQAAFVWNVLTAIGERTKGDLDPGGDVPRPALAWAGLRRGPQRACPGRLLARDARAHRPDVRSDRDHPQAIHREGRQACGSVLQDGDDPAVDVAGGDPTDLR